ncbi:DUF4407 domain-containing protein [Nocardia farcinica]|uniref:DUF4407 domain-containing protein n=1 Tax=Nocardia farcinica TaxID=37329 RepID=UPI0018933719|nr:DUF4407 domain-containing protein [Nocardia farcinica]MBF6442555.1 DUF4407 domain-containing protein [Nocardia farcinica]MBF6522942.1 DUF4407 domain-containing protein [Nocardia farcinica]
MELPAPAPRDSFRPVVADGGRGVRLRGAVGVREEILDWVPEERAKYTRLGAIVVNTAVMAAVSFLIAAQSVSTSAAWLLLLPIAMFWGYLIFSLDAWLIASTHGRLETGRLRMLTVFLPRLIVSVLFGLVIAEPLVLLVFDTEVQQQIDKSRHEELTAYSGRLSTCNPADGRVITEPGCQSHLVTVPDSPQAARAELQRLQQQRVIAADELGKLGRELADLNDLAVKECAGTGGDGLSGVPGEGPECRYNRAQVEQFRAERDIPGRERALADLDAQLAARNAAVAAAEATYSRQIAAAVDARVRERRESLGQAGLLEQIEALHALARENLAVAIAQWVVRLLLLAIDCLPVLAKMLLGATAYDALARSRTRTGRALHDQYLALQARLDSVEMEVAMHRAESDLQNRLEQIDAAARADRAKREVAKRAQIARLAVDLQRDGVAG